MLANQKYCRVGRVLNDSGSVLSGVYLSLKWQVGLFNCRYILHMFYYLVLGVLCYLLCSYIVHQRWLANGIVCSNVVGDIKERSVC